jgi:DNA polymerase
VEATVLPEEQRDSLEMLDNLVQGCETCEALCQSRSMPVFGAGSPSPQVMFVLDVPSIEDDESGASAQGAAGELLQKMVGACGFTPEEVYITTAVKCRPPQGRRPTETELAACARFLELQARILRPKAVVAFGEVAAQALTRTTEPITSLRGREHRVFDAPLFCTFHPAYLLKSPSSKREAWEDLRQMLSKLGRTAPR